MFVLIQLLNNSIFPMIIRPLNALIQVALYGSFLLIILSSYPRLPFQPKTLLLLIGTATSLIVNDVDAKYGTNVRWILWVLLLSSIGPMLSNKKLLTIRNYVFSFFVKGFVIITALSFLYYLLGLPHIGRGDFTGLMNQSMVLGPIAAISGIYSFYNYLTSPSKRYKIIHFSLSFISVFVLLLASSRLAFMGYIVGMIFMFIKPFKYRSVYIILIVFMGIGIYSRIESSEDKADSSGQTLDKGMMNKGMNNSRETLWNDRIREFNENPIFGVGFSAQNDYLTEVDGGSGGGRVEPGSGYLMILSMTGIFGMSLFLWFFYFLFNSKRFWNEIFKEDIYKLSIFAFFAIHFIGEGYIYSAGSMLASFFWLLVGVTFPYANVKKKKVLVKRVIVK